MIISIGQFANDRLYSREENTEGKDHTGGRFPRETHHHHYDRHRRHPHHRHRHHHCHHNHAFIHNNCQKDTSARSSGMNILLFSVGSAIDRFFHLICTICDVRGNMKVIYWRPNRRIRTRLVGIINMFQLSPNCSIIIFAL